MILLVDIIESVWELLWTWPAAAALTPAASQ